MFGLTTTRRLRAELADARAETTRQRERAERAEAGETTAVVNRGQVLRQNGQLDADNRRLSGRNLELGRRLSALAEADPEYAADLERQLAAQKRRADQLQTRLDDAVGLSADIDAGHDWRQDMLQQRVNGVS